jgi:exodeoxyribonuclease VII large subunit
MSLQSDNPIIDSDGQYARAEGREVYSISQLNDAARDVLEQSIGLVWVEGEISNMARPASGHIYFSLKDNSAQIRCAMFRNRSQGLRFKINNGLKVLARGRVSLYTARGDYQLIVDSLEPDGEGLLRLRFEQLKRRLSEEGLFDSQRKRELPGWPRCIGIVTSPSGAAVRDIVTVLGRRCPSVPIIVYPTLVQGDSAAGNIVQAIECANRRADCDVLIIGRGGGSLEDLWPFNEERVARAIAASQIPTVSAVGHEIDITIADLVADLRAPTPSAAAELVSPDTGEALRRIASLTQRLKTHMRYALTGRAQELRQLQARLLSPQRRFEANYQRVDDLSQRLVKGMRLQLLVKSGQVQALANRTAARSPANVLQLMRRDLEHTKLRLYRVTREQLVQQAHTLARLQSMLRALGPEATLSRGYAIVTDSAGKIVRDATDLSAGDDIETRVAQGRIGSRVTRVEGEDA